MVTLHGDRVLGRGRPIQTESAPADAPFISGIATIGHSQTIAVTELPINSILRVITELAAIANSGNGPLFIASGQRHQPALGILAIFGNDVNDAVDRVAAPQTAAGTANDLDPFDVG